MHATKLHPERKAKKRKRATTRSCPTGKRRFRDHREAVESLHRQGNYSNRSKVPVRSYACDLCDGFHVTSQRTP